MRYGPAPPARLGVVCVPARATRWLPPTRRSHAQRGVVRSRAGGIGCARRGQVHQTTVPLSGVTETAFTYFQQVEGHRFDEFLQRLRPTRLSPDAKERVLKILPQVDVVSASAGQQAKLHTLGPILRYHERESAIDVKVLRVGGATAAFLAGAAILITEPALEVLSSQELQATVAHELGHDISGTSSSSRASRGITRSCRKSSCVVTGSPSSP